MSVNIYPNMYWDTLFFFKVFDLNKKKYLIKKKKKPRVLALFFKVNIFILVNKSSERMGEFCKSLTSIV